MKRNLMLLALLISSFLHCHCEITIEGPEGAASKDEAAEQPAEETKEPTSDAAKTLGEKIKRIENSLMPAVVGKGEDAVRYALSERMDYYNVPAVSIAVINGLEIEWAKGYGILEIGSEIKVDTKARFQAASISKPVAATAALMLVEDGKLDLEEDINTKLTSWKLPENEFTADQKVTLKHLLSHSGGITVSGFPGYAVDAEIPTLQQILDGEPPANNAPIRVDIAPGSKWRYSGGGYTIAQQLMIDVSGKPFPEFMEETVLKPLGMDNSTYSQPLPEDLQANAAHGYRESGEMVEGGWHIYPEMAAAGLWTTPSDLALFAIEIVKSKAGEANNILSKEMTEKMLTRQIDACGLGLFLGGAGEWTFFTHTGGNEGFRCHMFAFTEKGQGAVIMTNGDNGSRLYREILRSLAAEYGWPVFMPRQIDVADIEAEKLEGYTGHYKVSDEFEFNVSLEARKLFVSYNSFKAEMVPESESKFYMAHDGAAIDVAFDEDGNVIALEFVMGGTKARAEKVE